MNKTGFHTLTKWISPKKQSLYWLLLITFFLLSSLLHIKISNFLVRPIDTPFGVVTLIGYSMFFTWPMLVCFVVVIVFQAYAGTRRASTLLYWGLWLGTVIFTDRILLFKEIEYIHYPQYALIVVLLTLCLDPKRERFLVARVLFWTTVLGIIDEMNQYFYLCSSYGDYLDFNDFFLNLQGAIAGVLLMYGFRDNKKVVGSLQSSCINTINSFKDYSARVLKTVTSTIEGRFVIVVLFVLMLMMAGGRIKVTPPEIIPPGGISNITGKTVIYLERKPRIMGGWNGGEYRSRYYVLNPAQGLLLLLATAFMASTYGLFNVRRKKMINSIN